MRNVTHVSRSAAPSMAAYWAFGAFGAFWGTWGAALPSLRDQADLTDAQLGAALLCVGAGALPAMLLAGRVVDSVGARVAAVPLGLLGCTGLAMAVVAHDLRSVVLAMLVVGATSGAADVAINTLAGQAEQHSPSGVLARAHGVFSLVVVAFSLVSGGLLGLRSGLVTAFGAAAAAITVLSLLAWYAAGRDRRAETPPSGATSRRAPELISPYPLLALGATAALAYAVENAHQSWGAVLITDAFEASPRLAALAPATFAATAMVARFALAGLSRSHPIPLLIFGGAAATAGSVVVATAPTAGVGLAGLALAAAGTAALFPTLLSYSLRGIDPGRRGRATSTIATTAYLGFLFGPAYVGFLAERYGIRYGILGIAAVALAFTLLAAPVGRWAGSRLRSGAGARQVVG